MNVAYWCEGKMRFATRTLLDKALKARRKHAEVPLHAYRCNVCGGWHIGQASGKTTKAVKAIKRARKGRHEV